jgi:signal transduction histidine kinase
MIFLSDRISNKLMEINGYLNIAGVYDKFEKPEKALPYLNSAEDYFRSTNDMVSLANTLHTKGVAVYKLKQYDQSIKCFQEALKIGISINILDGVQYLYESMAQTYSADKDYKNALNYYLKYMTVKDSVSNTQKSKELNEIETKYQTEKKQNEIIKLLTQKHEKNLLLYTLSGLILVLSILGYFIMKNTRNKKLIAEQNLEIKEQHILELEKERQLIATKSVLKGEESERSRMARDLHDGLGGLLSGVKINLSSMKGNSIISSANIEIFDQAIRLLDNSIVELRRVAHSLMPETLNQYGLKTAFNDYIADLRTDNVNVTFRFSGEDTRYNSQLELTLYRIAQELLNNALKHSDAKNIDLQLITETNRVCIQVLDDGKGFIVSERSGNGKGLMSIRDRVTVSGGRFDIESSPGHGTEATVEFIEIH